MINLFLKYISITIHVGNLFQLPLTGSGLSSYRMLCLFYNLILYSYFFSIKWYASWECWFMNASPTGFKSMLWTEERLNKYSWCLIWKPSRYMNMRTQHTSIYNDKFKNARSSISNPFCCLLALLPSLSNITSLCLSYLLNTGVEHVNNMYDQALR